MSPNGVRTLGGYAHRSPTRSIARRPPASVGCSALQNRDGGIPTFCRGWGALPFDRSAPDLTAHALRAVCSIGEWRGRSLGTQPSGEVSGTVSVDEYGREGTRSSRMRSSTSASTNAPTAPGCPLWFGNQHAPDDENPVYGTARVLAAFVDCGLTDDPACVAGPRLPALRPERRRRVGRGEGLSEQRRRNRPRRRDSAPPRPRTTGALAGDRVVAGRRRGRPVDDAQPDRVLLREAVVLTNGSYPIIFAVASPVGRPGPPCGTGGTPRHDGGPARGRRLNSPGRSAAQPPASVGVSRVARCHGHRRHARPLRDRVREGIRRANDSASELNPGRPSNPAAADEAASGVAGSPTTTSPPRSGPSARAPRHLKAVPGTLAEREALRDAAAEFTKTLDLRQRMNKRQLEAHGRTLLGRDGRSTRSTSASPR